MIVSTQPLSTGAESPTCAALNPVAQLSVTVMTLASGAGTLALHARFNVVANPLNTGGAVSNVRVIVCTNVPVFPHVSVAA